MTLTVYLITEDETDVDVVRAILKAKNVDLHVEKLLSGGGIGGLSRLVKDLNRLIQTAQTKAKTGDCIAVLYDADLQVQPDRRLYDKLARMCKRYGVAQVIAKDEIEAWLLADEGVCKWLDEKPKNQDTIRHPSKKLNSLVKKKTKRGYSGRNRDKVLQKMDGTGDKYSPSMRKAVELLRDKGCLS